MVNKMGLDKKILSEIERYNRINKYIFEQAAGADPLAPPPPADPTAPPPADTAATPVAPTAPAGETPAGPPQPLDVENDPDVEKIDDEGKSEEKKGEGDEDAEELDVTELVDSQKNIEQKQEEYFDTLFGQLSNLEKKLGEMDQIMSKLNTLENKLERYREKTPQERLELRTYDSYPFNQKLTDFFEDKKDEMEKTGKNDYVLTTDEVTDINVNDIKNSFQPGAQSNDSFEFKK